MSLASWQGPPSDVLGATAPVEQILARSNQAVIALQQVIAFPEGCTLGLIVAAQRGSLDDPSWERLLQVHTGQDPEQASATDDLRFGVRLPDGSQATTVDNAFVGWAGPTDRPDPPMLVEIGAQTASGDSFFRSERNLWLWPLPPAGPFEFVVEWLEAGIDATAVSLDGAAIIRAAEQAQPYWT